MTTMKMPENSAVMDTAMFMTLVATPRSVKFEVFVELRQAQESLESTFSHSRCIFELHVIRD